jgi:hypothetical protein
MQIKLVFIFFIFFSACENQKESNLETYKSQHIQRISISECKKDCDITSRIMEQKIENGDLYLKMGVRLNCGGSFVSKAFISKNILDIQIFREPTEAGIIEETACNCFYIVDFEAKDYDSIPRNILINGETFLENNQILVLE